MTKKILLTLATLGMAVIGSAKTYSITLFEPSLIGGAELKPGNYSLEVKDQKVVIRQGKHTGEAQVKVEHANSKYDSTNVRYTNGDGKYHIQEIHLGGTDLKLVVAE